MVERQGLLEHGGGLRRAAGRFGIPVEHWLDMSTGISPYTWPVPPLPRETWQRLPEDEDGLFEITCAYFGSSSVLAVAGSQAAIQALPTLRPRSRVGVVMPTYGEHGKAWRNAGHEVVDLAASQVDGAIASLDVVVVVNPNNPTGEVTEPDRLLRWHDHLSRRRGWLVVDEAFVEASPNPSLATSADAHLIVLRSLGKFWGLAGVRAGFVLAGREILAALADHLGPWSLSHPARWIARHALADHAWMQSNRVRLQKDSERLAALLAAYGLHGSGNCALFRWVATRDAEILHDSFARRGILIRSFAAPAGTRFGLPGDEAQWRRFAIALDAVAAEVIR